MKETGILFTPENHRLILSGQKTQTRRVIPVHGEGMHYGKKLNEWSLSSPPFEITEDLLPLWRWRGSKPAKVGDFAQEIQTDVDDFVTLPISYRYAKVGDKLYVKEGVIVWDGVKKLVGYYLDGCRPTMRGHKRLTAMFMPKWAARTWLEITDVRAERVQDISEEDCIAEGCPKEYLLGVNWYKHLWDKINGKKHPWASNPFVFAISFKLVKP